MELGDYCLLQTNRTNEVIFCTLPMETNGSRSQIPQSVSDERDGESDEAVGKMQGDIQGCHNLRILNRQSRYVDRRIWAYFFFAVSIIPPL